ncbi:solute carrier family 46 member 3-like isoform X2 [Anneissia japonica]|uniref:solute carrier family 46 member 3-like isoform X2 n=1 Tax=Anneissia japonica TaxID=1529436 RepID=UPI00142564D0|nr:solute carrier family 46 member 3-like isoform X2 [Anneissia japonica]
MARYLVNVESVVLITSLALTLTSTLAVLFIEHIVQLELNATCLSNSSESTCYTVEDVQVIVSNWTTIFLVCQTFPALLITLYVSTLSDRIGRKITMILPTIGFIVAMINYSIVYVYVLPIEYLLVGNIAIGFSGSITLVRSGASSYISDTASKNNLTFRLSVLQGVAMLGIALGQLGFSLWIEYSSFLPSFLFMTVMLVLSVPYIMYFIEETVTENQTATSVGKVLTDMIQVVKNNTNDRRCRIISWLILRFMTSILINPFGVAMMLYFIGPPLLWSTTEIGYFTFSFIMSLTLGMLFITKPLQKYCNMSDYSLFYLGSLSAMSSSLIIAAGTTDAVVYLSVPMALLAVLPKAIVEAQLSKLVEKNERGAIFAQAGVLDNLGFLLGPIWIGVTYSATVETNPSLIFYIMFAGALINMLLVIFIQLKFGSIEETMDSSFKSEEEYIASEETHLLPTSSKVLLKDSIAGDHTTTTYTTNRTITYHQS